MGAAGSVGMSAGRPVPRGPLTGLHFTSLLQLLPEEQQQLRVVEKPLNKQLKRKRSRGLTRGLTENNRAARAAAGAARAARAATRAVAAADGRHRVDPVIDRLWSTSAGRSWAWNGSQSGPRNDIGLRLATMSENYPDEL